MCKGHVVCNAVSSILIDAWDVHQEAGCHADQSLPRPGVEPVEHRAVDQCWELTGPDAELVPHRAEAQHDMQKLADFVDEEVPAVLWRVNQA